MTESETLARLLLIQPAERRIVAILKEYARFGPAYFVQGGYGRQVLVVHDGHGLTRADAINVSTWRGLQRHGLVTYDDAERIEYRGRQPLDGTYGEVVALTDNGWAL